MPFWSQFYFGPQMGHKRATNADFEQKIRLPEHEISGSQSISNSRSIFCVFPQKVIAFFV